MSYIQIRVALSDWHDFTIVNSASSNLGFSLHEG